jgi:sulfur carrier protein
MISLNGDPFEWWEGMTVQDVLNLKQYPMTMIVVALNGEMVNRGEYASTPVPDEGNIWIVQAMSGG